MSAYGEDGGEHEGCSIAGHHKVEYDDGDVYWEMLDKNSDDCATWEDLLLKRAAGIVHGEEKMARRREKLRQAAAERAQIHEEYLQELWVQISEDEQQVPLGTACGKSLEQVLLTEELGSAPQGHLSHCSASTVSLCKIKKGEAHRKLR